jgi:integrase
LILTGQRREEIGGLRWSEVIFPASLIRLPPARVKNGRAHDVPLSEEALALLRNVPQQNGRDFVFGSAVNGFGGYSVPKRVLDKRIAAKGEPMPPWVVHDVRRSVATHMASLASSPTSLKQCSTTSVDTRQALLVSITARCTSPRSGRRSICGLSMS